jgi:hypothetical protein
LVLLAQVDLAVRLHLGLAQQNFQAATAVHQLLVHLVVVAEQQALAEQVERVVQVTQ